LLLYHGACTSATTNAAVRAQVAPEPSVLRAAGRGVGVRAEHDDVRRAAGHVEGVEEVVARRRRGRRRPRRRDVVRHAPVRVVRLERPGLDDGEPLDLVVALGHHPRPRARQRLHQPAVRVPPRLDEVGVRQVAGEKERVVVRRRDVLQRRLGPSRLAQVTCPLFSPSIIQSWQHI
jgi:hypothetical protein